MNQLHGKQIRNTSITNSKLVEKYLNLDPSKNQFIMGADYVAGTNGNAIATVNIVNDSLLNTFDNTSNGLHFDLLQRALKLGGPLTQDTTIGGNGTNGISFLNLRDITLRTQNVNNIVDVNLGEKFIAITQDNLNNRTFRIVQAHNNDSLLLEADGAGYTSINLNSDSSEIILDAAGTVKYLTDYSANFTDRSIVDKKYVDDKIAAGSFVVTDGSGVEVINYGTAGEVNLGGTINRNTYINGQNTYQFGVTNVTLLQLESEQDVTLHADDNLTLSGVNGVALRGIDISNNEFTKLELTQTTAIFTDSRAITPGIVYADDYSLHFTDMSLVHKKYVDTVAQGLTPLQSVRVATTADISAVYAISPNNGQFTSAPSTIDGISLNNDDRILVKDQNDSKQNGVYVVVSAGTWRRSSDLDGSPGIEVNAGDYVFVEEGTDNEKTGWVLTADNASTSGTNILVLNVNPLIWVKFSEITVAGNDTEIQFNDNGVQGADIGLRYNKIQSMLFTPNITLTSVPNSGTAGFDIIVRNNATGKLEKVGVSDLSGSIPTLVNKNMTPAAAGTNGNGLPTTLTILAKPASNSYVQVEVNGMGVVLGTSASNGDCYFAQPGSGGAIGRLITNIQTGDELYWNGIIAGYRLDTSDRIDFLFNVTTE